MSSEHVRKGVTNAKFNEEQSNILFIEIGILSILIGLMSESWWAFGGSFLGLIFSLRIKFLAIPLMIVFSLVWGAIGYSIVNSSKYCFGGNCLPEWLGYSFCCRAMGK